MKIEIRVATFSPAYKCNLRGIVIFTQSYEVIAIVGPFSLVSVSRVREQGMFFPKIGSLLT